MLKIKDNVDLKELKKFKFKRTPNHTDLEGLWKYNDNMSLYIVDKKIIIKCHNCYFDEDIAECFEWIYELIKTGLVE